MTTPDGIQLLGVNMLFVAFVLYIIALNMAEKIGAKETATMCIITGGINIISAFYNGFILGDSLTLAANLLFGCTYVFFAFNLLGKSETNTGIGNYALGVALTSIAYFWSSAVSGTHILTLMWFLWGQLWATFWVANGLGKNIIRFTIVNTYIVAIINFIVAIGFLFSWL